MTSIPITRGTDLLFAVQLAAAGFDILTCGWRVEFIVGGLTVATVDNTDAVVEDGTCYVSADTSGWPSGGLYWRATAYIPDARMADGIRTETATEYSGYNIVQP